MGGTTNTVFFENYSPYCDFMVFAICLVIVALIRSSYISKTRSFIIFIGIIVALCGASICDVLYHLGLSEPAVFSNTFIYIFRTLYHLLLFGIFQLFCWYIVDVTRLDTFLQKRILIISNIVLVCLSIATILGSKMGFGFVIVKPGVAKEGADIFFTGYTIYIIIIFILFFKYGNRLYGKVMKGFYGTIAVSFLVLTVQTILKQSSFTTCTFLFPAIAMLYLVHSNPYDIDVGAVNINGFEDLIRFSYKYKKELLILSVYLKDFDYEGMILPEELRSIVRRFAGEFFKDAFMFQITNGHIVLCVDISKNPDYENKVNGILNAFMSEYENYRYDYKIIIGKAIDEVSQRNEYVGFLNHIHSEMSMNSVHFLEYDDLSRYNRQKYIVDELFDIYRKRDMNDPRVEVYCQPVFNIETNKYDTAEALMRLRLPESGMVFPDQFIPLAEQNNTIHVLTLIILSKTCAQIRKMLIDGYYIKRISINVSVMEMRDDNFCADINSIIQNSGIPEGKIAIEVTESQNENDFIVMRDKIAELKNHGIKFYLDDFGTGYSNFERIMELPFDIVKFDRSLVMASGENEKSEKMVGNLAQMFSNMEYSVLFEGVENENDEKKCINMSASYLQGYKYSRPIPINRLTEFFEKKA